MKKIFDFFNRLLESLLENILSSLCIFLIVSFFSIKNFDFFENDNFTVLNKILLLAFLFLISWSISSFLKTKPYRHDFRIITSTIHFEYLGEEIRTYTKYKIRSNRMWKKSFYIRKTWFPNEKLIVKTPTKGFVIKLEEKIGNEYGYNVIFPKPVHLFQTIEFEVELIGANKHKQFQPFYWYDTISPTGELIIQIQIPQKFFKKGSTYKLEFLDHKNARNANKNKVPFSGYYEWKIEPKLYWTYKFEWEWKEK